MLLLVALVFATGGTGIISVTKPSIVEEMRNKNRKKMAAFKAELAAMQKAIREKNYKFKVKITEQMKQKIADITGYKKPDDVDDDDIDPVTPDDPEEPDKPDNDPNDLRSKCDPDAKKFDWRDHGAITEIKHQGSCGSCYMFSAISAYESNNKLVNNEAVDLSEQHLLDCVREFGCNGHNQLSVWKTMTDKSVAYEDEYPYKARVNSCRVKNFKGRYKVEKYGYLKTRKRRTISDVKEIKQALCKYGELSSAVEATRMFTAYSGGVFDEHPSLGKMQVNHAVNIVGWDDSKKAFIIKNSWGKRWGENGYMTIEYGSNNIGTWTYWVKAKKK